MAYTKAELKRDLAAMGLTGTETILIHSSMKSIGPVEAAQTRFWTHGWSFLRRACCCCPPTHGGSSTRKTGCSMYAAAPAAWHSAGAVPAASRRGALAAPHPQHGAYGKGAAAYLEGELDANTPCTPGAATTACGQPTAKCCCWGSPTPATLFIHSVEEVLNVPNRLTDKPYR